MTKSVTPLILVLGGGRGRGLIRVGGHQSLQRVILTLGPESPCQNLLRLESNSLAPISARGERKDLLTGEEISRREAHSGQVDQIEASPLADWKL